MSKRVALTTEERGELVLRLLRKEATASDLAREASISRAHAVPVARCLSSRGFAGLNGRSDRDAERRRHARELAQRDQVIGEMTVALKVLKKTWGLRVTQELRDRVAMRWSTGAEGCV